MLLSLRDRQLGKAQGLIEKAITIAGPQALLLEIRANVFLASGQTEKALADMQEVIEQQAGPVQYFHLALVQQRLGRRAEAAESLREAQTLHIRPTSLHPLERPGYAELMRELQ